MTVYILCGASGAGKSTWANDKIKEGKFNTVIVSADHFFTKEDGSYLFDPRFLRIAHNNCLRKFVDAIRNPTCDIIVDNTNTTLVEITPYARLADAFKREVVIVVFNVNPEDCHQRNIHNVPKDVVFKQHSRLFQTYPKLKDNFPYAIVRYNWEMV